jgi:hypothetical protein
MADGRGAYGREARGKVGSSKGAGAGGKLSVEDGAIVEATIVLEDAMNSYRALGETPLQGAIDATDEMNTNFVARLNTMLGNLNRSNSNMLEKMETITAGARDVAETLREVDAELANGMGNNL